MKDEKTFLPRGLKEVGFFIMIGKSLSFAFEVMKCLRCLFRMAPMSINYNVEVTLSQSSMGFGFSCAVEVFYI